jgi:hypothetical protein
MKEGMNEREYRTGAYRGQVASQGMNEGEHEDRTGSGTRGLYK